MLLIVPGVTSLRMQPRSWLRRAYNRLQRWTAFIGLPGGPRMERPLAAFLRHLDSLREPAPLAELVARLQRLDITCDDVAKQILFSARGYTRNLVRGGEWYQALILCWKNGQRSPIHDHAG